MFYRQAETQESVQYAITPTPTSSPCPTQHPPAQIPLSHPFHLSPKDIAGITSEAESTYDWVVVKEIWCRACMYST